MIKCCAHLDRILTLCRFAPKLYSENILWTFIYFCAESAKKNERPKFFSEHDFDARRQRVRILSSCAQHHLSLIYIFIPKLMIFAKTKSGAISTVQRYNKK
jgi:hypothetical protein